MTALDGSGKTPKHRAASITGENFKNFSKMGMKDVLFSWRDVSDGFSSEFSAGYANKAISEALVRSHGSFNLQELSGDNGFRLNHYRSTPLQAAIIYNNFERNDTLLRWSSDEAWNSLYRIPLRFPYEVALDIMELVRVVGADVGWVKFLLKKEYPQKSKTNKLSTQGRGVYKHWWPTLHLVATYGTYQTLKLFINNHSVDPFCEDTEESSALHCVMRDLVSVKDRNLEFKTHLLDYFSCQLLLMKDQRKAKKVLDDNFLADRQGCVNLLLQAGCGIFKINKEKEVPYPQGRLSSSAKFLSGWYEKQAKEFETIQNSLNNAANAISVTATLVATTSFVGPLQLPHSYTEDNQLEYQNGWVATLLLCDNIFILFCNSYNSTFPHPLAPCATSSNV